MFFFSLLALHAVCGFSSASFFVLRTPRCNFFLFFQRMTGIFLYGISCIVSFFPRSWPTLFFLGFNEIPNHLHYLGFFYIELMWVRTHLHTHV